ncbi:2148_t:CDS:2, partial [Diversispora eburnea]
MELVVALISSGELDSELHYGLFSQNWWFTSSIKKDNNLEMMYSIQIDMKTQSGYTSQCDSDSKLIIAELLYDIKFHPYIVSIENKLSVMVFGLGISKNEGWM